MLGPTLGLLALFFGSAGAFLFLAHRFVCPIPRWSALFLLVAPFLSTGRAALTGAVCAPLDIVYASPPFSALREELGVGRPENPILSDVAAQMLPFAGAVREALSRGRWPLWNPWVLGGEPLLAVQQHGAFHPSFWLGLLLPLAQAWTFAMTLRLFLALLAGYLFFREIGCAQTVALFGAAAWAFSDHLLFFLGYPLQAATAPFPLLVAGLLRVSRRGVVSGAGMALAALLLAISAGHPETVLHATAGAGVLFLFDLAARHRARRRRAVLLALATGGMALGLSAFLLLPFAQAAPETSEYVTRRLVYARSDRSLPVAASLDRAVKNVVPYAFGSWRRGGEDPRVNTPSAYAGSLLFPLALIGLASRRREKWALAALGLAGIAAWSRLPVVNDAICRLPLFDVALNEYLVFLGAFAGAALAAFGLERLAEKGRTPAFLAAVGGTALALALLYLHVRPYLVRLLPFERRELLALQLVPLLAAAGLVLVPTRRRAGLSIAGALLALLLGQRLAEMGGFQPAVPSRALAPRLALLDRIPRGAPVRMAALGETFVPNAAALYGLEDARGYSAMTLATLRETFPLWCVSQPVWFNRVDDPARPFLSFLNVGYLLAAPGVEKPSGWKLVAEDRTGRLFSNPRAIPRAFVPRVVHRETDPARAIARLSAIQDFGREGVLDEPGPPLTNGDAEVALASYRPERLDLELTARSRALVATSMAAWPGWRLEVDGHPAPLLRYNRAFLAFFAPPGSHRASLSYRPRSFETGLAISGASLLLCGIFVAATRRRGSPPVASARRPATGANVRAADQRIQGSGSGTGSR